MRRGARYFQPAPSRHSLGCKHGLVNTQLWWETHAAQGDRKHGVVCKGAIRGSNRGLVLACRDPFTNRPENLTARVGKQ